MTRHSITFSGLLLLILILGFSGLSPAGNPHGAYYGTENDRLFWFVQTSDTHIGMRGADDSNRLQWLLTQARQIIQPSFFLVTGDLTDSTDGNWLGLPDGPYLEEWQEYRGIVTGAGMTSSDYFDIPGNHDAYRDRYFNYFLNHSIQGKATGNTQFSFTRQFGFGNYHFLGVNTAGNTGDSFSLFWPYGDPAGLDSGELAFIQQEMNDLAKSDSNLTLVFGHHPLFYTGSNEDTYVDYGLSEFLSLLNSSYTSVYGYGHTHAFDEAFFIPDSSDHDGFFYVNTASLGKSSANQYTIMAIDCDGLSSRIRTIGKWPAVVITAPLDVTLGGTNPYAYSVPAAASNPIRALVFDPVAPTLVQYRIDGGAWHGMTRVSPDGPLWTGQWDASSLPQNRYAIEVQAMSTSGTDTDAIAVNLSQPMQTQIGTILNAFGKYEIVVVRKTRTTKYTGNPDRIYQGETVVFRMSVKDVNGSPVVGAKVSVAITGKISAAITSTATDSNGNAEAIWPTSAPNKRGVGGTPVGDYKAVVTGIDAGPQYAWDEVAWERIFSISAK